MKKGITFGEINALNSVRERSMIKVIVKILENKSRNYTKNSGNILGFRLLYRQHSFLQDQQVNNQFAGVA